MQIERFKKYKHSDGKYYYVTDFAENLLNGNTIVLYKELFHTKLNDKIHPTICALPYNKFESLVVEEIK